MFINRSQFHKGFTLIETLFAVLIFSSALIALMTIAGRGISATADAEQETTASYLAQEGIEIVRNIRDTNYGNSAPLWDTGFSTCTQTAPCKVLYGIGATTPTLVSCGGTTCPYVAYDAQHGVYSDAGIPSEYLRTIYSIPAPIPMNSTITTTNEYEIVSNVSWVSKTIPHVVTLNTILKDWH